MPRNPAALCGKYPSRFRRGSGQARALVSAQLVASASELELEEQAWALALEWGPASGLRRPERGWSRSGWLATDRRRKRRRARREW